MNASWRFLDCSRQWSRGHSSRNDIMKSLALHAVAKTIPLRERFQLALVLAAEVLWKLIAEGGGQERLEDVPVHVLLRLPAGQVRLLRGGGDPVNLGDQVSDESVNLLVGGQCETVHLKSRLPF